jgi:hypothetical protein
MERQFALIEVKLQRGDISPILRGFVEGFKRKVYRQVPDAVRPDGMGGKKSICHRSLLNYHL